MDNIVYLSHDERIPRRSPRGPVPPRGRIAVAPAAPHEDGGAVGHGVAAVARPPEGVEGRAAVAGGGGGGGRARHVRGVVVAPPRVVAAGEVSALDYLAESVAEFAAREAVVDKVGRGV